MDRSAITAQLSTLVAGHVPSNARAFTYRFYDDQPHINALGFALDPAPFEGKVIAITSDALVIKIGRTQFAVVDRHLASQEPAIGATVHVSPYARRRFDGLRADTPEESTRHTADGQPYTVTSMILGTPHTKLPVARPQCPELHDLVQQLEQLPAPDRFRRIVHLLVDANARDFELVDPISADILRTPPEISFSVSTAKFSGRAAVIYDRGLDVFAIELRQHGACVERHDEVYVDDLGTVLEHLIDDGQWRRIHVDIISGPGKRTTH
ncbi:GTPase [Burkholderia sp. Bp9012]|uniref:GTPase n=1 Tax=Burkholderia sp. Bp9012 TaxID=2184562 RepID=UPI000F5944F2|nr:GTPase [Burkholderia sp. Bp9012]RQR79195.1 GTPase [Burkholderia sp. Bp9012]